MQLYTKILIGMLVGVVLGLFLGPNSLVLEADHVELASTAVVTSTPDSTEALAVAHGVERARVISTQPGDPELLEIEWTLRPADLLKQQKAGISQGKAGEQYTGWVPDTVPGVRRYSGLGHKLVGATEWIGQLFLALIKMVVVPLVFCSLVVGVASLGDFRKLGRLGSRTIGMFLVTTVAALVIGVTLANVFQPGATLSEADRAVLLSSYKGAASGKVTAASEAPSYVDQIVAIVPTNPVASMASGDMLQIIFFALMFGIALTFLETERSRLVVDFLDRVNDAMVMLVHIAMMLAPYGVAALLFAVVGNTGLGVLAALLKYTMVVLLGLLLHLTLTYGAIVVFGARLPFLGFLKGIRPATMLAFSTSSSSATLPVTKECVEDSLNVSRQVSSFVVPLGATVNMDGTALYQGVAAIFIAQIYGLDLSLAAQATIVLSATLASVGAAGVPGAGMITLAMVLTAIGVPAEGLALILGVDRLLDMFRTATNVVGDSSVTALMARLEGDDLRILSSDDDASDPNRGFEGRLQGGPHAVEPTDEVPR